MAQTTDQRRQPLFTGLLAALTLFAAAGAPVSVATAQPADEASAAKPASDKELADDFIHYILTSNNQMAISTGAELLSRNLKPADFANLVESVDAQRFTNAVQRGGRSESQDLRALSGALDKAYQGGLLARARDPEMIARNIKNLTGGQRARLLAREGLKQAGEYAMVQLLDAYVQTDNSELSVAAQGVMIDMGRQSIVPLTTALPKLNGLNQEKVARLLGLIPYKQSLPFLTDLAATTDNSAVRAAAEQSIARLGGSPGNSADQYRGLAEAYYSENSNVTSFPGEDFQLLWNYAAETGLTMREIRTPVFHEAMSMKLLERAMQLETGVGSINPDTLALWVASNYSREFDTPEGYANPAYPTAAAAEEGASPRRGAEYFGVASGSDVAQRVLARALDRKDTQLARAALAAVEQIAGGRAVADRAGVRSPLSNALLYPNRRVQLDAALAIAATQPNQTFSGAERVIPTLASAVKGSPEQYAVVLTTDIERYQVMRTILEKNGFTVLPQAATFGELQGPIAEAPSIDLVVLAGFTGDTGANLKTESQAGLKTAASPVLIMTTPDVVAEQSRAFQADSRVAVRPIGTGEEAIVNTITDLVQNAAGGPMTEDEALAYANRSLSALRDLAVSNNLVLPVKDSASTLVALLPDSEAERRSQLAEVLGRIGDERAQRSLVDEAIISSDDADRAMLLLSAGESAKRFGNLLTPAQVEQVLEMASNPDEKLATAAAGLLGALNVPNTNLLPLVLGEK
ncbi:MAG TPA: hypothetical protein VK157_13680 [Phycisphaerales bacterium]|nr:hypothetical protein [Phycisphaerales bacterium]